MGNMSDAAYYAVSWTWVACRMRVIRQHRKLAQHVGCGLPCGTLDVYHEFLNIKGNNPVVRRYRFMANNEVKTTKKANDRPCPHAKKCGGCQYQHLTYAEQLTKKETLVRKLIGNYCKVKPIIGMADPQHYRNKVHAAFGYDRQNHRIISGIYKPSTHFIVPVSDCMIEDRISDAIINDIRRMLPSFKLQAYDEQTGRGFLRHVLVRRGFTSGEVMVVMVASSPIFPTQKMSCSWNTCGIPIFLSRPQAEEGLPKGRLEAPACGGSVPT